MLFLVDMARLGKFNDLGYLGIFAKVRYAQDKAP